jgi:guanine nucleotide-binding protein G(I)/G(S)/G(T) subunit beta-1
MTCAFERVTGSHIASGGLDNVCSVYEVGADKAVAELQGHDGYLSSCQFVDRGSIITASGDSTCILWDVGRGQAVQHFTDHGGDVMSLSVHPTNRSIFVSGSCDTTAKVSFVRMNECGTGGHAARCTRAWRHMASRLAHSTRLTLVLTPPAVLIVSPSLPLSPL